MHEYSIVSALLHQVETEAKSRGATAVHRLRVQIGELSGVETDLLASAYELVRPKSLCAEAALEIVPVPARWACPTCDTAIAKGAALRCPLCELPARLTQGEEILLEQIEMEVA